MNSDAEKFYADSIKILTKSDIHFMIAGTYAVQAYTGIQRETKDIDFFCKAGDYPRILNTFSEQGYKTQATDERWIARVMKDKHFFDIIFNSSNGAVPITEDWFKYAEKIKVLGLDVCIPSPTELIWSKVFVQNRLKTDTCDVAHLILIKHKEIDWHRLLSYMEQYWEMLLIHVLYFRFIYPSEREHIPRWLIDELISRLEQQSHLPSQKTKICRGRLLSRDDFEIDITKWGYEDFIALR